MQQRSWTTSAGTAQQRPVDITRPHTAGYASRRRSSLVMADAAQDERETRGSEVPVEHWADQMASHDSQGSRDAAWPADGKVITIDPRLLAASDQDINATAPAPRRRRSMFRQNSGESNSTQKSTSIGRRASKKIVDWKENMAKSTRAGLRRQSSAVFPPTADLQAPTSPSKRNGRHDSDRPAKLNRHPWMGKADRKDTPAPQMQSLSRPGSRAPTALITGGEGARQAAGQANKLFYHPEDDTWEGQEHLTACRSRVGSCSEAADSAADLSSYTDSGSERVDADGDVEMTGYHEAPARLLDPVQALPRELSLQVFEYLDAHDLYRAQRVCRAWSTTANETSVWRAAFNRKYGRRIYTNPAPILVGGAGVGRPNRPQQEWKKMYEARVELDKNWRKGAKGAGKAIYLAGHTDSVYCLQFDEEKIITGSRDRTIRVWDINNFTCKRVIGGPNVKPTQGPKVLRTVDYPDFHLATASVNGTAYGDTIYHTPPTYHDASILCLQYDEQILVTGSSDSDLIVWDVNTYQPIKRLKRHSGGVLDVALDAKHIVSCSKDSRIIVWDRETYEPRGELSGHRGPVNAVQLRGKYLVSASGDGIARLWDLEAMRLIKQFDAKERGLAAVEFSEDMRYVLAGGNDTITYKFEIETGREVAQFTGHSQLVRSLWLDSQNNRVVSGSYDLDLRVYDFTTGEEIWRAEEWTTSWMLAAKSDYRRIVATSQDGRILIIDFGLKKAVKVEDGQPIDGVDLLRGTDSTSAIQWRNPWESTRKRDRERQLHRQALRQAAAATVNGGLAGVGQDGF